MRTLVLAAALAAWLMATLWPADVRAQNQPQPPAPPPAAYQQPGPFYPFALGLGALAGVVLYNVFSAGTAGLPFLRAAASAASTAGTAAAPATVSASTTLLAQHRVTTVASAVVGGWVANWLYGY